MLVNCERWSIARQADAKQMPRGEWMRTLVVDFLRQTAMRNAWHLTGLHGPANNFASVQISHLARWASLSVPRMRCGTDHLSLHGQ